MNTSPFIAERRQYKPRFPSALNDPRSIEFKNSVHAALIDNHEQLKKIFPTTLNTAPLVMETGPQGAPLSQPLRVGVVLSGGQAPGGHNVICGVFDGLKQLDPRCTLWGFRGGPGGILSEKIVELTSETIDAFRNTGGFDMLGSGRTKLESSDDFAKCKAVLEKYKIDGLVIIGGDDSNTNAAFLAEHLRTVGSQTVVVGVPKTIDGDLKSPLIETSFGFDTAVRLYAELISNIARDAASARKYYHFIRLMGRSASHITLEAALQTRPNIAIISEEIRAKKQTFQEIIEDIARVIIKRAEGGKNYGIILVPEGLIEFVPEMQVLIAELNEIMAVHKDYFASLSGFTSRVEYLTHKLSKDAGYTFSQLPIDIQRQLIMDRDPHGNVQVSRIETEKLLIELLEITLGEMKAEGKYKGKFAWQSHFLGYEGRCAAPTNYDADYAYSLGRTTVPLVAQKKTGYMAVVRNTCRPHEQWQALGVPLATMIHLEKRGDKHKAVIRKSLVELSGPAFCYFASQRDHWAEHDSYEFTGAIQYFGPKHLVDRVPITVSLERP